MSKHYVRIHSSAMEEIEAAVDWYFDRSQRAAAAFLSEFDLVIARISEHPEQFPHYEWMTRRAGLRRFP